MTPPGTAGGGPSPVRGHAPEGGAGRAPGASGGRWPRPIVATAVAGALLTAAYAAAYVAARRIDADAAAAMLRMYGLTIVAGREAAMFDALHRGLPLPAVYALSVVDDVGSLLLALPATWVAVRLLRRRPGIRWALARFEKQALQRRDLVQRWGLAGLALVYFLPGFGAGVPVTVLLGVLARIPFGRLVPFFAVTTLAVDGAWALLLAGAERRLPDAAWVDWIPATVVALVLAGAAVGAWRGRHDRHVALLDWPIHPAAAEADRLADVGITVRPDGLVRADLDRVRGAVGPPSGGFGRLVLAAELLLLDGMRPADAWALAAAGVAGIEGLAGDDPDELAARARAAGVAWQDGDAWVAQARRLRAAQLEGWRHPRASAAPASAS